MKKTTMQKVAWILVFAALTTALSGCGNAGDKTGESDSSSITIGIAQDLEDSLDPHKAEAAGTREVLFNVFEGLYKPDCDGYLVPAVASDYTLSEDGRTYTFTLREGVKFHSGADVTAEDVIASLEACSGAEGEALIPAFSNIVDITAENDGKEVKVVLKEQDPDFMSYIASVKAAIEPAGQTDADTNPIGTGPYRYVSRSVQENIVVEKFNDYWGTPANIDEVTFQICADADTIAMNLNGGSIDMMAHLTAAQVSQLNSSFNVLEGTMNLVQAVYLNHDFEPFQDQRVRQALCYAVDRQGILDMVSDGKGVILGSSMFPNFRKYYMHLEDKYPYDVKKAKELLKEAGYEDGFKFTITVPSNYTQHVDTAMVVAEQLKKVGITAEIQQVEWNTWLSDVYTNRNYEATVVGVDASNLTASAMLSRFCSDAGNNFINYNNPDYDTAYAAARAATNDGEEQLKNYMQCEIILAEDAANVYIQDLAEMVALNKKYTGYEFYPLYVQDISKIKLAEE